MTMMIVEHNVQDFNTWNAVFEGHRATREKHGITHTTVYRAAADPNRVCIIGTAADPDAIQDFLQNSDLPEVMEKAGVIGEPTIRIVEETTATTTI